MRERFGAETFEQLNSEAVKWAGPLKIRGALGWDTDRIYAVGPLALCDLAKTAGEKRLDRSIQAIHIKRSLWNIEVFFKEFIKQGWDETSCQAFRSKWDL